MRFIKPIDEKLLHQICIQFKHIITVEDGTIKGGFGSSVADFILQNNYTNHLKIMGIPDEFIHQGTVEQLHQIAKIDSDSIRKEIESLI
mgnify:CR=1 FL=1